MEQNADDRENVLLKMHEFYGAEARHQRSMMWETVKWFTPILTAIHTGWLWIYTVRFLSTKDIEVWIILALLFFVGFILCIICLALIPAAPVAPKLGVRPCG